MFSHERLAVEFIKVVLIQMKPIANTQEMITGIARFYNEKGG